MRCPVCGKELAAGPRERVVRFAPGAALDLRSLDWGERAFAHPPCGWVVVRPGVPGESTGRGEGFKPCRGATTAGATGPN
ncbi:hypothetical protein [Desulfovirgula thermocuniculi]|uniref:hypothetical protein n=1 Tax=Desulfovirgula thermocuniculi TaxID=348842 RepID=UPI000424C313|nr:hypothetical protein [Desulfovirgula thermocuniculi]